MECNCCFCSQPARTIINGEAIILPVAIRTVMWRHDKGSVVAYLVRIDGNYTTIQFGDGTVVDTPNRRTQSIGIPEYEDVHG